MRQNLPVTDTERHLRDGDSVVSRTNSHGIITYVNTTFCEISGYTQEELVGQPHNIMRHPDMPAAVFADLWATLKAGKAWKGSIKNRCKDGGFYWVEANANPIVADGEVVGYMSLRTRPTVEQVRHAQHAYADMRDASRHHRWRLWRGRIIGTSWRGIAGRLRGLRLRDRIAAIIVVLALSGLAAAVSAMAGMAASNAALARIQRNHLLPAQQMGTILRKMMENRILITDAATGVATETLDASRRRIVANQDDIAALVANYRARTDRPGQRALLERWNSVRMQYKDRIDATLQALERGEHERAEDILANELPQRYEPLVASANALADQHAAAAARAIRDAETRYARHWVLALTLLVAAAMVAGWLGVMLMRAVTRPLADAQRLGSAIGSGDLTGSVVIRNEDEIGDIVQATLNIAGNLRGLTNDVTIAAGTTTEAAFRIAGDARDIGLYMTEQKQAVARIATQIRELQQAMTAQLEHTVVAHGFANDNHKIAINARAGLQRVIASIDNVQQAVNRIGDTVTVMAAVASETDILALNAAERARTGDPHRALATVVDEVHGLAKRSRSVSGGARHMMSEIIASLDHGVTSLGECRELLDTIGEQSEHVAQLMETNVVKAHAHADTVVKVDSCLVGLTQIADDGADLSLRTMKCAAILEKSAELLLDRISFFTLPKHVPAVENLPLAKHALATTDDSAYG
ncbi:MAG: PAS domain-containing protein [Xanthomonadales bacterium]|nr:PAS domain-containing protein [Xanthomonadales bacterium]MDZ4116879.1 PAS domain-containing protein [Xanthomonadaceae bacterium]